jgi:hypothetical protein
MAKISQEHVIAGNFVLIVDKNGALYCGQAIRTGSEAIALTDMRTLSLKMGPTSKKRTPEEVAVEGLESGDRIGVPVSYAIIRFDVLHRILVCSEEARRHLDFKTHREKRDAEP